MGINMNQGSEMFVFEIVTPGTGLDYEDKFNALHFTRILAEVAGIIDCKAGHFQVKKTVQEQYQTQGIRAFFLPMLIQLRFVTHFLQFWGFVTVHKKVCVQPLLTETFVFTI